MAVLSFPQTALATSSYKGFGNYVRAGWPWYVTGLCYLLLGLAAALYGFSFGIYGQRQIAPFFLPLAIASALAMWAMPALKYPPIRLMCRLVPAFLFALLCWPDYIALALEGLPWITAVRLTAIPMAFLLLVCALSSIPFRRQMSDILQGDRIIPRMLLIFMFIAAYSIFLSSDMANSIQKYFVAIYAWAVIFFASAYYFTKPGRVIKVSILLLFILIFSLVVGVWESRLRHLPWAGHIPSFLRIQDERIDALLAGSSRAASGKYRVQSRFSTSIGLGEFVGMSLPFILQLFFLVRSPWKKFCIFIWIPIALWVVLETDSRLAFICFLSSLMLYCLYQAFVVWRDKPTNLFAPAVMMAYPIGLAIFIIAAIFWRRLNAMIMGDGAAQFSTDARHQQIEAGMPIILRNPLGHGIGQASDTLGYFAFGSGMPTIDTYYLAVGLEFGVLGFIVYYFMFGWAVWRAGSVALKTRDKEIMFLGAAAVALFNFTLSKSVYAQTENHPFAFLLLGMVVALLRRYKAETGELPPPPSEEELIKPKLTDRRASRASGASAGVHA